MSITTRLLKLVVLALLPVLVEGSSADQWLCGRLRRFCVSPQLPPPPPTASPPSTSALEEAVTEKRLRAHVAEFERIAVDNSLNRGIGTPGWTESVEYVKNILYRAGFTSVLEQVFQAPIFVDNEESTLTATGAVWNSYTVGFDADFAAMYYTPYGYVSGFAEGVWNEGCLDSDYDGFIEGNIAVVSRGTCSFREKAIRAEAAGAAGLIVFNKNSTWAENFRGSLGNPDVFYSEEDPEQADFVRRGLRDTASMIGPIPVFSCSYAVGEELLNGYMRDVMVHMYANVISYPTYTSNVIAEKGSGDQLIMLGAHLDAIPHGNFSSPGVNDNGSGCSALLVIAESLSLVNLQNTTIRLAFFGAEELGLFGSFHYVNSLEEEERSKIDLYLNFDMLGSQNFVRFIYEGGSDPMSEYARSLFEDYFSSRALAYEKISNENFGCNSDNCPFDSFGIPTGGLYTGSTELKTGWQEQAFGGKAWISLDSCYHDYCDREANVNFSVLTEMAKAAAHATQTLAETPLKGKGTRHKKMRKMLKAKRYERICRRLVM